MGAQNDARYRLFGGGSLLGFDCTLESRMTESGKFLMRISDLESRVSNIESRISNLESRVSNL